MFVLSQEWQPTAHYLKLRELAERYHAECEAYDRTVCTGPITNGEIMPETPRQSVMVTRNSRMVFHRIEKEAAADGIGAAELWREIGRIE